MMGGEPLYLLRNALVPLSASAHASYGAARFCTGLHPHTLRYGGILLLKLLLLAAAGQTAV